MSAAADSDTPSAAARSAVAKYFACTSLAARRSESLAGVARNS